MFVSIVESIHQEFSRRVLEELCRYYQLNVDEFIPKTEKVCDEETELQYKYPVIWCEGPEKNAEMNKLENLVDTTDGFLMLAFEDFFVEKREEVEEDKPTLFET